MAAITLTSLDGNWKVIRTATAQATTGQTDWIAPPRWAKWVKVRVHISANAGTTPTTIPSILSADPNTMDDTRAVTVLTGATITTASFHEYTIGPSLTTAGTDQAAAGASIVQNCALPTIMGIKILNDRGTGDETYTYTVSVEFGG